jgi:hypothetical protein
MRGYHDAGHDHLSKRPAGNDDGTPIRFLAGLLRQFAHLAKLPPPQRRCGTFSPMKVELSAITEADLSAVGTFLNTQLNSRVSAETWARALLPPWSADTPNHGYLLRSGAEIVGAYLAFYSEREVAGRTERFCNLGAWCVRPEYRLHSVRLLRALTRQPGYTFVDLSPSGSVVELNRRSGFEFLDSTVAVLPNLPWPTRPGHTRINSDPRTLAATLTGEPAQIFADHRGTAAAHHLLIRQRAEQCYVIFRRDRRKNLPLFGSLIYASDPAVLRRTLRPVTRHLLLRHRLPATLVELRLLGEPPRWTAARSSNRKKMYKSSHLAPEQIDNLYSELVCVPW